MVGAVFTLAGALLVLFTVLPALSNNCAKFLPLGGTHIAQLAIILGFAFVIGEFIKVLGS